MPGKPKLGDAYEPTEPRTVQRSPLHPLTPHRRSPDHGSTDELTQGPNEKLFISSSCHLSCDANACENSSVARVGDAHCSVIGSDGVTALEHQFQQLLSENARLKDEVDSKGGDDIMTQQLLQQLQNAMADKSKISKEKDELIRENCDLRTLLAYLAGENLCGNASDVDEGL